MIYASANAVYGYVNGKPVFNRDEFIFTKRGFGAIKNDNELLAYAKKLLIIGRMQAAIILF